MRSLSEHEFLEALQAAYNLGAYCAKKVSFGEWTNTDHLKERVAINRILRKYAATPITEEEQNLYF